LATFSW